MHKPLACLLLAGILFHPVMGADLGGFTLEEETDGNTGPYKYLYYLDYVTHDGQDFQLRLGYETILPEPKVNYWGLTFFQANGLNFFGGGDDDFHYRENGGQTLYIKTFERTQGEIREMLLRHLDKKYYREIQREATVHLWRDDLTQCEQTILQIVVHLCDLALEKKLDLWAEDLGSLIDQADFYMPIRATCYSEVP